MEKERSEERQLSIQSMQSTVRKLENALSRMTASGSSTTLVAKRLAAVQTGLAALENAWHQVPHYYGKEELAEARQVLKGLLPTVESSYDKAKAGSPQRTLLERRIQALKQALKAIDGQITE